MKATLRFTLPEELEEFNNARNGPHFLSIIEEMKAYLRTKTKYESHKYTEEQMKIFEEVTEKLYQIINDSEVY